MMTERRPLVARLKRWTGSATIGLGAVAAFLTAVAGLAALVLVFGAAARLLIGWWQSYPK
jgi:hypothetical protein